MIFSKTLGLGYYGVDVDLITKGVGKIPAIDVLSQSTSLPKVCQPITEMYTIVVLSSETVTFVIAIEPEVNQLYRWARNGKFNIYILRKKDTLIRLILYLTLFFVESEDDKDDVESVPSLSFGWANITGCARSPAPIIARGWQNSVQFLEVTFPGGTEHSHAKHGWPQFEEHTPMITKDRVLAVQWLGDQIIAYLMSGDSLVVYDTLNMQKLEVVDISSMGLVYANYMLQEHKGRSARIFSNR